MGSGETAAADEAANAKAVTVKTQTVRWQPINDCIALVDESWELPAADSGIVSEISVTEYQTVEPGQVVAKLNQKQAEAAVKIAQFRYEMAVMNSKNRGPVDYAVQAKLARQHELDAYKRLAPESYSKKTYNDLVLARDAAIENLNQRRLDVSQATMQAQMLETQVLASKNLLNRRTIRTREAGIVTDIKKDAGEWISEGETIAVVANYTELGVDVSVDYASVDPSKIVGTKIRVQPGGAMKGEPVWLQGEVTSYERKVSGRGQIRLHCKFRNAFHRGEYVVLPGSQIHLEMAATEAYNRLSRLR